MTQRQFGRACVANLRRMKAEHGSAHAGRAWLAWHIAAWIREQGSEGLPTLEQLTNQKLPTRKQTAREQVAIWQLFAARFGGEFKPVEQH